MFIPQTIKRPAKVVSSGLQFHLDAGQSASYGGSGQTWADLTVNNLDFYLGKTVTVTTDDPTFNGVAGDESASEYFSYDGGDTDKAIADYAASILRTAGRSDQAFSLEFWLYLASGVSHVPFSNASASNTDGFNFGVGRSVTDKIDVLGLKPETTVTGTAALATGAWHQIGLSGQFDGSTTCRLVADGLTDKTFTLSTTWSTGDSADFATISGRDLDTALRLPNGNRIAIVRAYDRALASAEWLENFNAQKGRFGL